MKRFFLLLLLLVSGIATNGWAYSFGMEDFTTLPDIDYTYGRPNASTAANPSSDLQGTYLGTVYGANDDLAIIADFLKNFANYDTTGLTFYGKSDANAKIFITNSQEKEDNVISGTWQTYESSPSPGDAAVIDLLIVKGGLNFSVHLYDPASSSGEWNVGYLPLNNTNNANTLPSLSHLTGYKLATPVPEPATMLLLGAGLIGLAGVGRKKLMK